jgi:hypothetical protein
MIYRTFFPEFDDYFITSIAGQTQTSTQFWGILVNYQFTPVGGCQFQVKTNDEVLWAFDAFSKTHFLKLSGPVKGGKAGKPIKLTVTDGSTGAPVEGATVNGQTTNASGEAQVVWAKSGVYTVKAEKADSIRSAAVVVVVV